MEKQVQQIKEIIISINWKRISIISLLIFFGILTITIAKALIIALSIIPLLPGLLQLIGLIIAIRFSYDRLLYAESRAKLWQSIKTKIKNAID